MDYRKAMPKQAILKRITGLQNIKFKGKPAMFGTDAESHRRRDNNHDGEFIQDFEENIIGGAVTGLAPHWNDLEDTYWVQEKGDDKPILKAIVEDLKLRYPDDDPDQPRKIIKYEDIVPTKFFDPFFMHLDLQEKEMVSGKYVFEPHKDPIDALLYYCYYNDPHTIVRGQGGEISKYTVGKAKFEIIIPSFETAEEKSDLNKEIKTLALLGNMPYEKQKMVARVLKVRLNDYNEPNPDELLVALGKFAKGPKKDEFIRVAGLSNEDLVYWVDITKGQEYRFITTERGEYLLNQEKLDGVKSDSQLFTFFKSNDDKYKDLLYLIGEKEKTN